MDTASAETWRRIEESELDIPGVTSGTGFGRSVGLRISGKVFALFNNGELVLKLPRARVGELIESGDGQPWGPGTGKIMKEWVAVASDATEQWAALVAEARAFVGSS
jgi:hypothetical protein